jgi:excinuclease ABC subunit B
MEGARSIKGNVKKKTKDLQKDLPFKIKEDSVEGLTDSIEKLENQMFIFAKEMEFEKAALCRDKIKYLRRQLIDL